MGTYTHLYISDYPISSSKSGVNPYIMTLFKEENKRIHTQKFANRNSITWGNSFEDRRDEDEIVIEYTETVKNIKDRLNIMGFSLEKAIEDFYDALSEKIDDLERLANNLGDLERLANNLGDIKTVVLDEKEILLQSNATLWIEAYREIITKKLTSTTIKDSTVTNVLTHYIVKESTYELDPVLPYTDMRFLIRIIIEALPEDALMTQDITDLVNAGYYDQDDQVSLLSLDSITEDYLIYQKIIILTEGSTDAQVLEKSLALLYPHLRHYYSFMNFSNSNAPGGASYLVSTVKSFIGAGITNRVIAIFDNDTAAKVSIKQLSKIDIPNNFRIMSYPDIEIACDYPTLGPGGIKNLNINGLACSIEMYFGNDILTDHGSLTPIKWKGYDQGVDQYQGEILRKNELQQAFMKKLESCIVKPDLIQKSDWLSIELILQSIFNAFN